MRIYSSGFFDTLLPVMKKFYWTWLGFCFLFWFIYLSLFCESASGAFGGICRNIYNFFEPTLKNDNVSYFFPLSTLCMPIIFIIISIYRRKVSAWEFASITLIWGVALYNISFWPKS